MGRNNVSLHGSGVTSLLDLASNGRTTPDVNRGHRLRRRRLAIREVNVQKLVKAV